MTQVKMSDFMSPEHACGQLQKRLDVTATQMRRLACANAKIIVTDASVDEKNKTVHPGDIQYDKEHCQNDRRNGSKFCQACSDKHHEKK